MTQGQGNATNGAPTAEVESGVGTGVLRPISRNLPVRVVSADPGLPEGLVAVSDEMHEIVSVIRAIAPTEITVLLLGESGTGKEVLARLIHDLSQRRHGPFVTVNCGAIPEGLIESELFGHEKGSFTGAHAQRKGFFEAAHKGTIFLDEIGEMPLNLQVKLLRVLETRSFTRVGSTTQIATDARVIAATNRDLELEVRAGRFRADLYYRLRAVMLRIPPLRNRREDIPFLIEAMLKEFVERHKLTEMPRIESDAIHVLIDNEWRGNIRELRNVVEQLVVLSAVAQPGSKQPQIRQSDVERVLGDGARAWQEPLRQLPLAPVGQLAQEQSERELIYRALIELRNDLNEIKEMIRANETVEPRALLHSAPSNSNHTFRADQKSFATLEEREHDALKESLERSHGNRREAALALGISERTLYRKLKEQGLGEMMNEEL
jgi:transcriptional regulator with PAS, ATPase and Fis domain